MKESEEKEGLEEREDVQQGSCKMWWIKQRNMVYGGDGLSADRASLYGYGGTLRSVRATQFKGEGWVDLWKEIRKE